MPPAPIAAREQVVCVRPFVVRRRVLWGECDPAGVVYTPRFADFAADAGQAFIGHALGDGGYQAAKHAHGIGTPCKAMSFVFHASLRPDDVFDMHITVGRIGQKTFELLLAARTLDGDLLFESSTTLIAVRAGTRQATPLPEDVRQRLRSFLPQPADDGT